MFRRRHPRRWWLQARSYLWPHIGWDRAFRFRFHRVARLPATAHGIAAGFASGAAVSFIPLMGFHLLLAAILALATRGSVVASALGTIVGNPWTFPLIWVWTYNVGVWLGVDSVGAPTDARDFAPFFADLFDAVIALDADRLTREGWRCSNPCWWVACPRPLSAGR